MTTPTFVNVGAGSGSGSTTSLTPPMPASLVTNNLLIAYCEVLAAGVTITLCGTGWSSFITNFSTGMSAMVAFAVFGSQTAPTFSWTGAHAANSQIMQYTGNLTSGPLGASLAATGTTLPYSSSGITTTANNSTVVALVGLGANTAVNLPQNY